MKQKKEGRKERRASEREEGIEEELTNKVRKQHNLTK
jgi:hypothetical protein